MLADAIVVLSGIDKEFDGEPVLRRISLSLGRGELVALVGRSGSGKSTLLHIIGGLDRAFRGSARVLGLDLATLGDRELADFRNRRVGLVFQSFHLLDHLTCGENVALPAFFATAKRVGDAREALDRVGLADFATKLPGQLSGGQKQRVAIARALFHRPDLLLADEPTGNLDTETGQKILELFQALHGDGLTLLIVTHEERISRAARRVIQLEDGRLLSSEASG